MAILCTSGSTFKEDQSINTTGSAKKIIVSDLGILRGMLSVEAASSKDAYQKLQ